ncbi:MAG: septal ring lytic transglycosylase RlpA family protein [Afipia felis]|nr:septal ring lytic transglycosylase RlpA family protein [Afipia felis]
MINQHAARRACQLLLGACACLLLANCAPGKFANRFDPKYGVSSSPRVVDFDKPVPKGGGTYRIGKPYQVAGRTYVPEENTRYRAEGLASWYGDDFHGRLTANGEVFDMTSITAAHPTLPMPCYVRVTNTANGKSLIVRVNDRGPYHGNRIIDVSHRAATLLDFRGNGVARVRVEYVGRAPLEGSDDALLVATLRTNEPAPAPSSIMVASAAPFVPQMPAAPQGVIRSDIPLPAERPYTLGSTEVADSAELRSSYQAAGYATAANSNPGAGRGLY